MRETILPDPARRQPRPSALTASALAAVAICVVAFLAGILRIQDTWYFEDDPWQYAFAAQQDSPLDFFTQKDVIQSPKIRYIAGKNLTPGLFASFWIDDAIAPRNPRLAYWHQIGAATAFFVLAFLVAYPLMGAWMALWASICCLALPSTIAVSHFLSTRHYIEGGVLLLSGLLFLRGRRGLAEGLAIGLIAAAALWKEIYFPIGTVLLAGRFAQRRRWIPLAATGLAAAAYLTFRWQMVGFDAKYPGSPSGIGELLAFVGTIPTLLTASVSGYVAVLAFAAAWAVCLARRTASYREVAIGAALVGLCLLPIIPASMNLVGSKEAGTWYRLVFLSNIAVVFFGFFAVSRLPSKTLAASIAVLAIALQLQAALPVRAHWAQLKDFYYQEARFYLDNPAVVVESRVPAHWFLSGVDRYFDISESHHVTQRTPAQERERILARFEQRVWALERR
jgi:hypothetical protein